MAHKYKLKIRRADITELEVDCIVNAANSWLRRGGGVCGAIFKKAGSRKLQEACDRYGGCKTGNAVVTPGYDLPARYIIHAVGPVWHDGTHNEAELLKRCYSEVLMLAVKLQCESIAFPLLSAGSYGYPPEEAWRVALGAVREFFARDAQFSMEVTFAVIDDAMLRLGEEILLSLDAE